MWLSVMRALAGGIWKDTVTRTIRITIPPTSVPNAGVIVTALGLAMIAGTSPPKTG